MRMGKIALVPVSATMDLRNTVLRQSKGYAYCHFDCDELPDTFHLALMDEEDVPRCVLTCYPNTREGFEGQGYQLRGMATDLLCQGKGYGKQVVERLIVCLEDKQADYVWCNARQVAFAFYERMGFVFISDTFDVPGIGPHRAMLRKIK